MKTIPRFNKVTTTVEDGGEEAREKGRGNERFKAGGNQKSTETAFPADPAASFPGKRYSR